MITKGKNTFNNYFPKRKFKAGNLIDDKEVEKLAKALEHISENDFFYKLSTNAIITRSIKNLKASKPEKYYQSIYNRVLNIFIELDDSKEIKDSSTGGVAFYKFVRLKNAFYLKPDSEDEV